MSQLEKLFRNIFKIMKALFYNFQKKKFFFKENPPPQTKEDEVLVRIRSSALCGTDLHIIKGPLTSKIYNKKEIILGHAFAGVVIGMGKKVKNFKKGDRIFASSFIWCGKCKKCREGKENFCDDRFVFGMEAPGSHTEHISVPQRAVFHLPKNINFNEGSFITDNLALDFHAFKKADVNPSEKVLIFGAGPVGLILGMLLRLFKIKSVFVSEPGKYRQNLAKKLFNPEIIFEKYLKNFKNYFDVVFEVSGDIKTLDYGQKLLKRGGKMIMIGVQSKNRNLNFLKLISRELSLLGVFEFTVEDIKKSLKLLTTKKINLKKVITHKFPLIEGEKAYRLLKNKRSGKIILTI